MSEWDDLVKALDDFIKWGDYFFEEERKTKEEPEEEPEMETKWEYAEDSDFEDSPKKTFGLNKVYLFKAKNYWWMDDENVCPPNMVFSIR